jgi:hypothetical protein
LKEQPDMSKMISTDRPLSEGQQVLLTALLDTLLPASADGRMPSAADVGFERYLRTQAEDFIPALASALEHFESTFAELPLDERCERVSELCAADPALFQNLLTRVYDCYYQNDQVRTEIGVVTGAPFPQGNEITPGDLSLLDPVIESSARHRYRQP